MSTKKIEEELPTLRMRICDYFRNSKIIREKSQEKLITVANNNINRIVLKVNMKNKKNIGKKM